MAKAKKSKADARNAGGQNDNIEVLLEKANKAGILTISAAGELSERIVRDAIRIDEVVDKYCIEHSI
jgi:hypothetical protein